MAGPVNKRAGNTTASPGNVPARPGADPASEDDLNNRLFFRLFQAGNIYERQALKNVSFSGIQGALLGALSREREHGIPLATLVDYLSVSRQNLDGVLKRMEKLGLVERIEDPANRRVKVVKLTAAGAQAWSELFERSLEFYRQGTRGLTLRTRTELVETLGRLNRALKEIDLTTITQRPRPVRRANGRAAGNPQKETEQ